MRGTVKWFNEEKGYGFLTAEDGRDVFCHRTALAEKGIPREGQTVEFETEQGPKGLRAASVRLLRALACLLLATLPTAGCSPTQRAWVDRGLAGVDNARANQTAWYAAAVERLNQDRQRSISTAYQELLDTWRSGVPTAPPPATTTRPIDAPWVLAQEKMLLLTMDAYDKKKADLDDKYATAMKNLDGTAECFTQIERLNVAWADTQANLQTEIDRLSTLVQAIAAKQAAPGKPRRRRRRGLKSGQDKIVEAAIGQAWEAFTFEHPRQARDFVDQFGEGEIPVGVQAALEKNAAYRQLLAETDFEASGAALLKTLASAIGPLIGPALAALA